MTTSLSAMRLNVRDYLDEASADRWTDAELNRYINQGIRQVQSQIQAANEDYFLRVETATAATGTYELAFPTDVWGNKLRSLIYYQSTAGPYGTPYRVAPSSLEDVYSQMDISGTPYCYTLHAGFLRWAPICDTAGTFRFVYAMKESPLTSDVSVLGQIADEHTDCISIYAAILARMKVGAPTQELYALYGQRMLQITNDVQPLDPVITPQVRIDD